MSESTSSKLRSSLKGARVASLILLFLVHALVARMLIRSERARRRYASRNLSRYCIAVLGAFGVRLKVEGIEKIPQGRSCYVVSNHLSYLDVLLISSRIPALFVTSVEVQKTPGLGQICEAGGSYFVERRNRNNLSGELDALSEELRANDSHLVVFPEATSTNGDGVFPFKKALFDSAIRAGTPVLPICIRYTHANGKPVDRIVRDSIFYYGDMTFVGHFLRFIALEHIDVVLTVLDPIPTDHGEITRQVLAERTYSAIAGLYGAPFGTPAASGATHPASGAPANA